MSHVFISYSKRNKPYARRLADHLIASGFDVWIDDRIDYGSLWVDVIQQAIEDCAAFVVIMTPEARESQWVQTECEYALQQRKRVFPVLLAGEVFFRYVSVQYADVTDGSLPLDAFLDELAETAPRKQGQGANVTSPEACEPIRSEAIPIAAPAPRKRKRTRAPLFAAAGIVAVLLLIALVLALQDQPEDDPGYTPTPDEVAQAPAPTERVTQTSTRTSESTPRVTGTGTPQAGNCRYEWFFGDEYALPGDCPASEPIEFEGLIQNFGEGLLIGLSISSGGRYFMLSNSGQYAGQYVDLVGEWDTSTRPVGRCAIETTYGFGILFEYEDVTLADLIGCPLELVEIETLTYQTSSASGEFVVYIGTSNGEEAYRLVAPSSRPEIEGEWQQVR